MMFSPLFTPNHYQIRHISARFLYELNLHLLLAETRAAKMSNLARHEANIPDRIGVV